MRVPNRPAKPSRQTPDPTLTPFLRSIGQALLARRLAHGLTQQEVAELIGIQPESVSRIEHGLIAPTLSRLRQFARLYDSSLAALVGEASDQTSDLAARITRDLGDLNESDRQFVVGQMLSLIRHLRHETRSRGGRSHTPPAKAHKPR